jgi:hypothetical protein
VWVVLALQNHEVFGVEATLALATVLVVPWVFLESLLSERARQRPRALRTCGRLLSSTRASAS